MEIKQGGECGAALNVRYQLHAPRLASHWSELAVGCGGAQQAGKCGSGALLEDTQQQSGEYAA